VVFYLFTRSFKPASRIIVMKTDSKYPFSCCSCKKIKFRNPRIKKQKYCSEKTCQKARKARWQREQVRKDPDYRKNQKEASCNWRKNNPEYYQVYRKSNPQKADRNRLLQRLRRKGIRISNDQPCDTKLLQQKPPQKNEFSQKVAKMDTSDPRYMGLHGVCWLIPVAKMDASKVFISRISSA